MEEDREIVKLLLNPVTRDMAFQKLINDYKRPLYFHIRNIIVDHDDTDDVLQNTFVKVFRNLKGFKGESKLFSWIYRIATNEALTFLAQRKRRNGHTGNQDRTAIINNLRADEYFDADKIELKLQQAVATLPQKQQLVFQMKYYQDLKYEEISEILGTSTGALKASYHHAVKKIEMVMSKIY